MYIDSWACLESLNLMKNLQMLILIVFCEGLVVLVVLVVVLVVLVVVLVVLGVVLEQVEAVAKPLLLPVLKNHPQDHQNHHQDYQNHQAFTKHL